MTSGPIYTFKAEIKQNRAMPYVYRGEGDVQLNELPLKFDHYLSRSNHDPKSTCYVLQQQSNCTEKVLVTYRQHI
jgi:hypothetical protein